MINVTSSLRGLSEGRRKKLPRNYYYVHRPDRKFTTQFYPYTKAGLDQAKAAVSGEDEFVMKAVGGVRSRA